MARYNDGRTARSDIVTPAIGEAGLSVNGEAIGWDALARADDGRGDLALKRKPDTGERFRFDDAEIDAIRQFAPQLLSKRALPREGLRLVAALMAVAASLAGLFLFVLPMEAEPVSHIMPVRYREHLADIGWRQVEAFSDTCDAESEGREELETVFDNLRAKMHGTNAARLEIVESNLPNAFTLPDDSIVLTTGMIQFAERPDEIAGVLAHELGHVEARHVLPGIVRQMGAGLFIDVVFGGSGAGQIAAAVNILSLRFSRENEAEADQIGYRLMDAAGYDPAAMATLFTRFGNTEKRGFIAGDLLSSHPDSGKRAAEAKLHARPGRPPAMEGDAWKLARAVCESDDD